MDLTASGGPGRVESDQLAGLGGLIPSAEGQEAAIAQGAYHLVGSEEDQLMLLAGALGSERQDGDAIEEDASQPQEQIVDPTRAPDPIVLTGDPTEVGDDTIGSRRIAVPDAQDMDQGPTPKIAVRDPPPVVVGGRGNVIPRADADLSTPRPEARSPPLPEGLRRFDTNAGGILQAVFRHVRCQVDGKERDRADNLRQGDCDHLLHHI